MSSTRARFDLGLGELLLGLAPPAFVATDPGDLLEQRPSLLGSQRERLVDHALADEQEGVVGESAPRRAGRRGRAGGPAAVEQVVVLAGAVEAAAELHDAVLDREEAVGVVEHERHVGHARRALGAPTPAKMTSSLFRRAAPRPCSPSAQRRASARLLLPDPFGPTMALMPGPNSTTGPLRERLESLQAQGEETGRCGHACGRLAGDRATPASAAAISADFGGPALAHPEDLPADRHLDPEHLLVIRADRLEQPVVRALAVRPLGVLLEPALGALEARQRRVARRARAPRGRGSSRGRRRSRGRGRWRRRAPRTPTRASDGRVRPPRRASPSPRQKDVAEVDPRASRASPAALTMAARRAERTPSSSVGVTEIERLGRWPG